MDRVGGLREAWLRSRQIRTVPARRAQALGDYPGAERGYERPFYGGRGSRAVVVAAKKSLYVQDPSQEGSGSSTQPVPHTDTGGQGQAP